MNVLLADLEYTLPLTSFTDFTDHVKSVLATDTLLPSVSLTVVLAAKLTPVFAVSAEVNAVSAMLIELIASSADATVKF